MICDRYADSGPNDPVRLHPYEGSGYDDNVDYYDLVMKPWLIREKLEDFKPFEEQEAIQTFYKGLEWLNGPASVLESNDCAFKGARTNTSKGFSTKLQCSGRLMVFYRELHLNLIPDSTNWLLGATVHYAKAVDPEFYRGALGLSFVDAGFVALRNAIGRELQIQFWAFGDTEEETFQNLKRVLDGLFAILKGVSDEIAQAIKEQTGRNPIG